jgi:hypothetical protein
MKNITENFYLTDNDDINHANFSNSKKSNNDKTTMSGYLKDYLIDFDFKKQGNLFNLIKMRKIKIWM